MNLKEFLVRAKRHTYASGEKSKRLADGFNEFVYEEGEFTYRDRYHAKDPKPFGGEEVVWQNGKAIWMMNYYGYMVSDKVNSERVYGFLRKAMSLVSEDAPFRGPAEFNEEDFEYVNEVDGDVGCFKGTERILWNGEEVYRLDYHGGEV